MANPTLSPNEIFSAISNMIISQQVFADPIAGNSGKLVNKCRVDGSLYGDQKVYYSSDALKTYAWTNDSEAGNLLQLHRPEDPEVQAIKLDVFRQIPVTIDNYLTKRAWIDEGSFSAFNSVMLGWLANTKKVYEEKTFNVFVGTAKSATVADISIDENDYPTLGQGIAETIADLFVELGDASRDFNDYGFLRSYSEEEIRVVWNAKYVNQILKVDLPTIYHKDGLVNKLGDDVLPAKYFGDIKSTGGTVGASSGERALVEKDYTVSSVVTHCMPGDLLPVGANYGANEVYVANDKIICKVMAKDSTPWMSAFSVETSFYNPRSLTETHFLTFGHNTPAYLKEKPFITIKKA